MVVLFLLIHCSLLFVWVSVFSPCFVIHYAVSFKFCNHLDGEKRIACFILTVFLVSCDSQCSVALPDGAVGWSAMCDCGIS